MTRLTHGFMLACMVAIPLATAARAARAAQAQESRPGHGPPAAITAPDGSRLTQPVQQSANRPAPRAPG